MENLSYSGQERRKFPRLRLRLAIVYEVDKPLSVRMYVGNKEIVATILDLSEGGVAISTNYDIPIQSELSIKFTLLRVENDGRVNLYGPMEINGEVRYNTLIEKNLHRLGICFTRIDDKDRAEIVNFVKMTMEK